MNDDARSVERAQQGHREAYGKLVEAHYRAVYAITYAAVGDWSVAQDLSQETFLVAWRQIAMLRKPKAFPAWLHEIARNLGRSWLRSASYRQRLTEHYAERTEAMAENSTTPDAALAKEEAHDALWQAVETLSPALRETVVLFYLQDRSVAETAKALGISNNAVKKRTQHARKKLRAHFEERWETALSAQADRLSPKKGAARIVGLLALPPAVAAAGEAAAAQALASTQALSWHGALYSTLKGSVPVQLKTAAVALGLAAVVLTAGLAYKAWRPVQVQEQAAAIVQPQDPAPPQSEAVSAAPPQTTPAASGSAVAGLAADAPEKGEVSDSSLTAEVIPLTDEAVNVEAEAQPEPIRVSGYVVDEEGMGIRGAIVSLLSPRSGATHISSSALQQESLQSQGRHSTSDVRGYFSFSNVLPKGSRLGLAASASGYSTSIQIAISTEPGASHEDLLLTLKAGFNLYGEVRDPNGQPVPGALVTSIGFAGEGNTSFGVSRPAVADSYGRFVLGFDVPGATTLEVRSDALGGTLFPDVPVGADEIIVLQWLEGGTLEGTITGADQYGPNELSIALNGTVSMQGYFEDGRPSGTASGFGMKYQASIHEDGRYRIKGISTAQAYKAHVRNTEGEKLTSQIRLDAFEEGKTQVFDYTLEQTVTIAGVVRGAMSGKPLGDIRVRWRNLDNAELRDMVEVIDDGTYRLELRVPAGRYVVYPTFLTHDWPEYQEAYGSTITVEPGTEHAVDLTFLDPVTRTVLVIDEFGEPIAEAKVGYNETNYGWGMGWKTDENGRFTYRGVRPYVEAHLTVYVPSSGYKRGQTEAFAAEPGEVFEEEVVVLYPVEE